MWLSADLVSNRDIDFNAAVADCLTECLPDCLSKRPPTYRPLYAPAPAPDDEALRLETLAAYGVMDTGPELDFDDLTALAAAICDAPVALISLVDAERQWFKSRIGLDCHETEREIAFCSHALHGPDLLVVKDTLQDPRFAGNPLVLYPPKIRFYAGAPLQAPNGVVLGTLCIIDFVPRTLSPDQGLALHRLARQVVALLEWRHTKLLLARELSGQQRRVHVLQEAKGELERMNAELRRKVSEDGLTGLCNRYAFEQALHLLWRHAGQSGQPLSLLMLDVDHFKIINDRYGHATGDAVLRQLGALLKQEARAGDIAVRWGGEEFALLLPGVALADARQIGERIRRTVEQADWLVPSVSISIGCAENSGLDSSADLQLAADRLLYCAKRTGRNRVL